MSDGPVINVWAVVGVLVGVDVGVNVAVDVGDAVVVAVDEANLLQKKKKTSDEEGVQKGEQDVSMDRGNNETANKQK